ncbi:hypothetical protein HZC31_02925 [Candidatus Woesearchaeota archaeon]|nr:hypothetical protein [Candidatus Woesearchaeota archaeon]
MQEKKTRPDTVSTAVTLLWIIIAVGVVRSIIEFSYLTQILSSDFIISAQTLTFAIIIFFIYMIAQGRNWARLTFLVIFILGIPFSISPMMQSLINNPFSGILGIGQIILEVIALRKSARNPISSAA